MFLGREGDECEDNPLKVHVVFRQTCLKSCPRLLLFLSQISSVSLGTVIFPLEIRPVLSPIKKESLEESRCS